DGAGRGRRAPRLPDRARGAPPPALDTGVPEPPVAQAAEKGPSASLAPSAARSTYREYASHAALGRRLASGPFCAACGFSRILLARAPGERREMAVVAARGIVPVDAEGVH